MSAIEVLKMWVETISLPNCKTLIIHRNEFPILKEALLALEQKEKLKRQIIQRINDCFNYPNLEGKEIVLKYGFDERLKTLKEVLELMK